MQKILIVEDDIDIQDILKNHLIDAGYEVAVASDGVTGIAMFDDTIDLVLLKAIQKSKEAEAYTRAMNTIRFSSEQKAHIIKCVADEKEQSNKL